MLTEAETKEIEKDIAGIAVNRANFEHIAKTGKINGNLLVDIKRLITTMAEKKNLEIDRKHAVNVELKIQLEAAQAELATTQNEKEGWNRISVDYAVALEKAEKIIAAKEAELERVKTVAEKMAKVIKLISETDHVHLASEARDGREALTEFANLMNKEK